jgi:hypothetical protein
VIPVPSASFVDAQKSELLRGFFAFKQVLLEDRIEIVEMRTFKADTGQ